MTDFPPQHPPRLLSPQEHDEIAQTLACVRHVGVAMVVAAGVLAFFNSSGLQTWARDLPGNAMTDRWVNEADSWHGLMTRLGFAGPKPQVQTAISDLRELSWLPGGAAGIEFAREIVSSDDEERVDWASDTAQD